MQKQQGNAALPSEKEGAHREKKKGHLIAHSTPVRTELISERAYWLFEERGCVHGYDLEDWYTAEKQLTDELLN